MKNELSLVRDFFPFKNIFLNDDWDDLMGLSEKDFLLPLDYEEKKDRFLIGIDMPGVKKDDVSIEVNKGCLLVKGARKEEVEKKSYTEKRYGSFQRVIKIPENVQCDKICAEFKDGVLTLDIPKGESAKAKVIPIK